MTNVRGVSVPGWAIATLSWLVPILVAAFLFGGQIQRHLTETHETFVQVCRIEFRLAMERPDGCPIPRLVAHSD